jgi:hypothetical protein
MQSVEMRMSTVVLEIKDIGLCAYMKMNGFKVLGYDGQTFQMEGDDSKSFDDWSLEYTNSCCCTHDNQLLQLRDMVRRHNNM